MAEKQKIKKPQDDIKLMINSESQAKWFYVDDFFVWLGCKFVTCDKDNKKVDEKSAPTGEKSLNKMGGKSEPQESKNEAMRQEAVLKAKKIKEQMEKEEEVRLDLLEKKKARDAKVELDEKQKKEKEQQEKDRQDQIKKEEEQKQDEVQKQSKANKTQSLKSQIIDEASKSKINTTMKKNKQYSNETQLLANHHQNEKEKTQQNKTSEPRNETKSNLNFKNETNLSIKNTTMKQTKNMSHYSIKNDTVPVQTNSRNLKKDQKQSDDKLTPPKLINQRNVSKPLDQEFERQLIYGLKANRNPYDFMNPQWPQQQQQLIPQSNEAYQPSPELQSIQSIPMEQQIPNDMISPNFNEIGGNPMVNQMPAIPMPMDQGGYIDAQNPEGSLQFMPVQQEYGYPTALDMSMSPPQMEMDPVANQGLQYY